jgi:hypothetical protein
MYKFLYGRYDMKRLLLLAGAAALCTLAMFAIYCADIDFNDPDQRNPLDERGPKDHWVWGNIDDSACQGLPDIYGTLFPPGFRGCKEYIQNYFFNPAVPKEIRDAWDKKLSGCTGNQEKLEVSLVGDNTLTFVYNHPNSADSGVGAFTKQLGIGGFDGVITYNSGSPRALLTKDGVNQYNYPGYPQAMPESQDQPYIIRYIVTRSKCGSDTDVEEAEEARRVFIKPYIPDDATPAKITICGTYPTELTVGATFSDLGCVSTSTGAPYTRTITKKSTPVDVVVDAVNTADSGIYTIFYKFCRTLTIAEKPVESCDSVTKTVTVKPKPVEKIDPTPVIVLNKYTYNFDGKPFTSFDTAFGDKNVSRFADKGVAEAYYLNESGVKVSIASRVKPPQLPAEFNATLDDGNNISYTIDPVPGEHLGATATRKVYITTNGCEGALTMNFTFRTLSGAALGADTTLILPTGTPWGKPTDSFRVTGRDSLQTVRAFRFGVDLGALNADNPQPQAGGYKITYIGLSECSVGPLRFFRSKERNVIVQ